MGLRNLALESAAQFCSLFFCGDWGLFFPHFLHSGMRMRTTPDDTHAHVAEEK